MIKDCYSKSCLRASLKIILDLLLGSGEQIGFGLFVFSIVLIVNKSTPVDFYTVEAFVRVSVI